MKSAGAAKHGRPNASAMRSVAVKPVQSPRASDTETDKAKGGKRTSEMERFHELANNLSFSEVMDGGKMGDKIYAARRFKPTEAACQMKLGKLLRKASAAEQLASSKLHLLTAELRNKLYIELGVNTQVSVAYAQQLLAQVAKEAGDDFAQILSILGPCRSESQAEASRFNLTAPKLCDLDCEPRAKVEIFEVVVVQHLLVGWIMKGEGSQETVMKLTEAMADFVAESREAGKDTKEYTDLLDHCDHAQAGLKLLTDANPIAVTQCTFDMAQVTNLVLGVGVPQRWALVAEALDEASGWKDLKKHFRRALTSDMTLGRDMKQAIEDMEKETAEPLVLQQVAAQLSAWRSRCRPGGTRALEDALLAQLNKRLGALVESGDACGALDSARALDTLINQVQTKAGLNQIAEHKAAIVELKKRARLLIEEGCRSLKENTVLSSIEELLATPSPEAVRKVCSACTLSIGTKFTLAEHVSILERAMEAVVEALGSPLAVPFEPDVPKRIASMRQMKDHAEAGLLLVAMMRDVTVAAEASKLKLTFLACAWSVAYLNEELTDLLDTPDAEKEEIQRKWDALKASVVEADNLAFAQDGADSEGGSALGSTTSAFDNVLEQGKKSLKTYAESCVEKLRTKTLHDLDKLEAIAGGIFAGGSWKDACAGKEWDDVLAEAMVTLFGKQQKGIARQLTTLRSEVLTSLGKLKQECTTFNMLTFYNETHETCKDTLRYASSTVTEAKLIQTMKGQQADSLKLVGIQSGLDDMVKYGLTSDDIQPALFSRAHSMLQA